MKKKISIFIVLAFTLILTVNVQAKRGSDGQLNLLYWQAPSTMNPNLYGGTNELEASSIVLEPLVRYDEKGNMLPWLVEQIPTIENGGVSEDLTSITWKIKSDIKWSDGTPLTADDVVFTHAYCTHPETGCAHTNYYTDIKSIKALDRLTIKVEFEVAALCSSFPMSGVISGVKVPLEPNFLRSNLFLIR